MLNFQFDKQTHFIFDRHVNHYFHRNYIQSEWCMEEFFMAHARLKEGRKRLLIPVMMEDIRSERNLDPTLQLYLKAHHYIEFTPNMDLLRKKLVFAMPRAPLCDLLAAESAAAPPGGSSACHVQVEQPEPSTSAASAPPPTRPGVDTANSRSTIHGLASDKVIGRIKQKYPGDKMRERLKVIDTIRKKNFERGKQKRAEAAAREAAAESSSGNRRPSLGGAESASDEDDHVTSVPTSPRDSTHHSSNERTPLLKAAK